MSSPADRADQTDQGLALAVVDDERIFREGLQAWLRLYHRQAILVAQAESVGDLLRQVTQPPQVVVLDVWLRCGESLAASLRLLAEWGTAVVVVTSEEDCLEMVRVSVDNNALAFLPKGDGFDMIWQAVCSAASGDLFMNPTLARYLRSHHPRLSLTAKQTLVLQWSVSGMQTREIAARMYVTDETVKSHLRAIRDKCAKVGLKADTRDDLRKIGTTYGLLDRWRA